MRLSSWVPRDLREAQQWLPDYITPDALGQRVLVRPKSPHSHESVPYPLYWDDEVYAFLAQALMQPYSYVEHCDTPTSKKHLETGNVVKYFTFGVLERLSIALPSSDLQDKLAVVVKYPHDKASNDLTCQYDVDGFTLTYFLSYANNRGRS